MEYLAQLHLGPIQDLPPTRRQRFAAAVDLKSEHRHGRPEGARFASPARLGGPFQRQRDLSRAALLKDSALQVERVAPLHDAGRPFAIGFLGSGFCFGVGSGVIAPFRDSLCAP